MSGLRVLLFVALFVPWLLLSSCSFGSKDRPPAAGTITGNDGEAAQLYAEATAAESSGNLKRAEKRYEKVASEHPYSQAAPDSRFRQASILDRQGELIKAFDAYQDFIQRYPSSSLYSQAIDRQAVVAHAAADGRIKSSFLGLKSRIERKRATGMLEKVRDNAPRTPSAAKAQFTIGRVWESDGKNPEAIDAYGKVLDDYPLSSYAPEAQYRVGSILLSQSEGGNQNQANLDRARHAFEDLLQEYPGSARASDAKARLSEIAARDIQRSFDIAEFYRKKGQSTSAAFYYNEVIRNSPSGSLHDLATQRLVALNGS